MPFPPEKLKLILMVKGKKEIMYLPALPTPTSYSQTHIPPGISLLFDASNWYVV